jgi:hypothetical protein
MPGIKNRQAAVRDLESSGTAGFAMRRTHLEMASGAGRTLMSLKPVTPRMPPYTTANARSHSALSIGLQRC